MEETLEALAAAQMELRDFDKQRAGLLAKRDRLMMRALESGATWAKVQETTGLGPRGIALAVKRESA